jgi:hypothetical protein
MPVIFLAIVKSLYAVLILPEFHCILLHLLHCMWIVYACHILQCAIQNKCGEIKSEIT